MEVSGLLGGTLGVNDSLVGVCVLLGVLGSVGGSGLAGDNTGLLGGGAFVSQKLHELSISLLLLEDILGDSSSPKTKHKHTCEYDELVSHRDTRPRTLLRQTKSRRVKTTFRSLSVKKM